MQRAMSVGAIAARKIDLQSVKTWTQALQPNLRCYPRAAAPLRAADSITLHTPWPVLRGPSDHAMLTPGLGHRTHSGCECTDEGLMSAPSDCTRSDWKTIYKHHAPTECGTNGPASLLQGRPGADAFGMLRVIESLWVSTL